MVNCRCSVVRMSEDNASLFPLPSTAAMYTCTCAFCIAGMKSDDSVRPEGSGSLRGELPTLSVANSQEFVQVLDLQSVEVQNRRQIDLIMSPHPLGTPAPRILHQHIIV